MTGEPMHETVIPDFDQQVPREGREADPLRFQSSPGTVGVELELPILDRESGDVAPGARRILEVCKEEGVEGVDAELMQTMLEVRGGIACNIDDLRDQILPTLRKIRNIASSLGYDFAMTGTHPSLRPAANVVFPSERFEQASSRMAGMTYYRVTFGLHIHVGIESGDQAVGITNMVMANLPHLLALSANSPYWDGTDTGLASCRSALYGLVPHAGVPRVFKDWREFRTYFEVMRDCKAVQTLKDIKWDIRPRPDLGTLEFRICDMPHSLKLVFALAAVTRSLVISAQRLLEEKPRSGRADRRRQWVTVENKWLATRYGAKAFYIRSPKGKRRRLEEDLAHLLDRLQPVAAESGDDKHFAALRPVDRFESGADRQRGIYRDTGDWKAVIADTTRRLSRELDVKTTNQNQK